MTKFKMNYYLILFLAAGNSVDAQDYSKPTVTFETFWHEFTNLTPALKNSESISIGLGDVYIADTGNNRVVKLNSQGEFVMQIGGFGWKDLQFDQPVDLYTPDGLSVYVADKGNQRIQRLGRNLDFIESFGNAKTTELSSAKSKSQDVPVGFPCGVTLSSQGDLFYSDGEAGKIVKMNRFGVIEHTFGGYSVKLGSLDHPGKIVVTKKQVMVTNGSRIAIFDYFGNYLRSFGETVLKKPSDICIDARNRLYVSDSDRKSVFVFDDNGKLLTTLLEFSFERPSALDIYKDRLYVLDGAKGGIAIFHIQDEP